MKGACVPRADAGDVWETPERFNPGLARYVTANSRDSLIQDVAGDNNIQYTY